MGNKTLFQLCATAVALLSLAACGEQSKTAQQTPTQNAPKPQAAKPAKGVKIGFSHCCVRGEISTMDASEDAIKEIAAERGATLIFDSANESQTKDDLMNQVNQVKKMIDNGSKSVIVVFKAIKGKDADKPMEEVLQYAKEKGVTVIAARRPASKAIHSRYDNVISVASSAAQAGAYQGRMVIDQWQKHPEWDLNGDGKMQFMII